MKISKRKKRLVILLLIIAVIFSVFAFLVPFKRSGTFWIAYIASILSFLLQIPVFKILSKNAARIKSKILGIPLFLVGYLYICVQIIVSLILSGLDTLTGKLPVEVSIAICVIIPIAAIICGISDDSVKEEYTGRRGGNSLMKTLCMKADNIALKAKDDNSRHMLELVAESIRYSSPDSSNKTRDIELRLKNVISQLDRAVSENSDIVELCAEIARLLNERNEICKMSEH